jgi:hypothetical protein
MCTGWTTRTSPRPVRCSLPRLVGCVGSWWSLFARLCFAPVYIVDYLSLMSCSGGAVSVLPVTAPTSAVLSVIFQLYVAFGHPAWASWATLCALHFGFPTVLTRISACSRVSRGPRAAHAHHGGAAWPRNFFFLMEAAAAQKKTLYCVVVQSL